MILPLLLALAPAAAAPGQEAGVGPPAVRSAADTLPGPWREGGNAAALSDAGLAERGRFFAAAGTEGGALRRPQQAREGRSLTAGMAGTRRAAGWSAAGTLAYTRRWEDGVRWSAVADPYAGSPYVWADSSGGDWAHDGAALSGALAAPALGRVRLGAAVDYGVRQGARRNDPRPLYRLRTLGFAPGAAVRVGSAGTLGATVSARWTREEDELGGFAGEDPFLYRLRGYGTFDRTQLVRGERVVLGRELRAGLQYALERGGERWSVAAAGFTATDSAREGVAAPRFGGRYTRTGGELRAALRGGGTRRTAEVALDGYLHRGRGTDPVFRAVNTTDSEGRLGLRVATWRAGVRETAPLELAGSAALRDSRREDVVALTRWRATAVDAAAEVRTRRPAAGVPLLGAAALSYTHPLVARFDAERPTAMTPVLVRPDFHFHAARRVGGMLAVGAEFPSPAGGATRLWARGRTGQADGAELRGRRTSLELTLEIAR